MRQQKTRASFRPGFRPRNGAALTSRASLRRSAWAALAASPSGRDLKRLADAALERLRRFRRDPLRQRAELLALLDIRIELLARVRAGELDRLRQRLDHQELT